MKTVALWFFFSLLGYSELAVATQLPQSLSSDPRMKTVVYQPDNVVTLHGTPLVNSQIILGQKESVIDIQCGDLAAWSMTVVKATPNVVNIKPNLSASNTDMTITTINDRQQVRRYTLHLVVGKSSSAVATTFSIRYVESPEVPSSSSFHSGSRSPVLLDHDFHWDYLFHGCRDIVPLRVFDDGRFTYFMLQDHQPTPAFFAVTDKLGRETLLNMRHEGDYWIALQTAPQFTLRSSDQCVASIFNHRVIKHLKHRGRVDG